MSAESHIFIRNLAEEILQAPSNPSSKKEYNFYDAEELKKRKQDRKERKKFANHIFAFTCTWTLLIIMIIFFTGLNKLYLSDLVLTTLIGSTTINVFVFFKLVTEYLFNKDKST